MIRDYFRMAVDSLLHRKMRSWLTMIGIFIGITAVVAIISLGQGLQVAINDQFEEMGIDKIFVTPGTGGAFSSTTAVKLTEADRRVIERSPGIEMTAAMGYKSARIEHKDEEVYALVMGVTTDTTLWADMNGDNVEAGRNIEKGDVFKAFVGYDYSQDKKLFPRALKLGDRLVVNGVELTIIGFQEDFGNSNDNQQIQITEEGYRRVFGENIEDDYQMILAKTAPGAEPAAVAENVRKALRNERDLDEGDEDFSLQTAEQFLDSFNSILLIVQVVIIGIAAISLLVGGIGIMNTMYTAVVERTQEIGIMKAIGARNSDVLLIFLIESGMLGLIGGIVGVAIGLGVAYAVEIGGTLWIGTPYLKAWWSWGLIGGALAFSFITGASAGLTPAWQASKQKPVDSLRYE